MSGNKQNEEDCSCYAKSRTPASCDIRNVTHPLRYYEFTQDEIKVLEECDKESFYRRCVPFSTLFATITYAAIKYGFLNRNPHFGVVPKVIMAAFLGHVYGRLTYLSTCDAKLRELPKNSHLGNVMRQYYLEHNPPPDPNKKR
ncbi:OCIA domain-containing protein 1-like [Pectinophora gossypiella]|uniref:OCIA domain-containing protein 1-like n=1 Tax=Pectinophora gossypiella TaxID=13191 RepID=UPI00214EF9A1|nr:OCIA domain-containing protein 1-like [Pectinophora gossypiella]